MFGNLRLTTQYKRLSTFQADHHLRLSISSSTSSSTSSSNQLTSSQYQAVPSLFVNDCSNVSTSQFRQGSQLFPAPVCPKTKLSGRKSWPKGPARTLSMVPQQKHRKKLFARRVQTRTPVVDFVCWMSLTISWQDQFNDLNGIVFHHQWWITKT